MPKRTNEFQKLVYMLQLQLAEKVTVTESAMLPNRETGEKNEVDILLECMVGSVPLNIGIECTATSRKASIEWVQRMYGKHKSLPLHASVLVSKSGFSKAALETAVARNIHTMALEEAEEAPWLDVIEDLQQLALGFFKFSAKSAKLEFEGTLPDIDLSVLSEMQVYRGMPDDPILVSQLINAIIANPRPAKAIMRHWLGIPREERPDSFEVIITWQPTPGSNTGLVVGTGPPHRIPKIDVVTQVTIANTSLQLTPGVLGDTSLAYGTAKNIADCSIDPKRDIVIALSRNNNRGLSGQMMVPGFEGGDDRVFEMKFVDSDE